MFPNNKCLISIFVPSNNKPKVVQNLSTMWLYDSNTSVSHVFNVLFNHGSVYTSPFIFNGLAQVCNGVKLLSAAVIGYAKSIPYIFDGFQVRSGDSSGHFKMSISNSANNYCNASIGTQTHYLALKRNLSDLFLNWNRQTVAKTVQKHFCSALSP